VYEFKESNALLLLQMCAAVIVLLLLQAGEALVLEPLTLARAKALAPVALLYNANVAFALASLTNMNVPMYNTIKRLTPAIVLSYDYFVAGATDVTRPVVQSVVLTVAGCLVAGYGDLSFDLNAYAMALTSCVLQVKTASQVRREPSESHV